jgi:hypothetical protein
MMTPTWLNSIVREFGTSMGIENLSLYLSSNKDTCNLRK